MKEPYQELASAIMIQRIQDYLDNAKRMLTLSISYLVTDNVGNWQRMFKAYEDSRERYLEVRQYLLSASCDGFASMSGEAVTENLDAKVREYGYQILLNATHKVVSKNQKE